MQTKVVTAHIPLELAEKVDALAGRLERPRGWIVKQALRAWIEVEDERDRLMQEGLAAIDAGDVVAHAVVQDWVDALGSDHPVPKPRG
ncbi:MAG TPA: ribbon-helix-helix domain-containing protein [Caulobacteraceae bacterium]|nr:ribbon-helix-helix domain-containing protein [Caulobacteraceae bacterium]